MDQAGQIDYKKILKGTTTIGLVCSDGVVVGADSRATMDNIIGSSEARKIFKIDGNLAMTIAGGVGDAQELIRIMKVQNEIYKMNEGHPLSPKSAASLASIILQENRMYPLYVWPLIAGMDADMPQLFNVDPVGGSIEESKFTSVGSGSQAALGYIEDMYKKGLSTKDAVKGVARALTIAMRRDSASGDNILIAVINKAGYTEYTGKELEKIIGTAK